MRSSEDKMGEAHDEVWLRKTLVELLQSARSAEEPDYAACAKLADLIFKLSPKSGKPPSARVLEMIQGQITKEGE